jgi:hypothetical protein
MPSDEEMAVGTGNPPGIDCPLKGLGPTERTKK